MTRAVRIFYVVIGIQLLAWLMSTFFASENWIVAALFCIWIALVPLIGFFVGRSGGKVAKACGLSTLLFFTWFLTGAVDATFSSLFSTVPPPNLWLEGLVGYALSCFLFAAVALLVVAGAVIIGRRLSINASA